MKKAYKAIFFDWDGTAVVTRDAPVDEVIPLMVELLKKKIFLVIISGTTYERIAHGRLHEYVPGDVIGNMYMGLARGAYNYGFDCMGNPFVMHHMIPPKDRLIKIHEAAFALHKYLLEKFGYKTDIVFSRPNYCKIDLLVDIDRCGKLYFQPGELELVNELLQRQGYTKGISGLIDDMIEIGMEIGIDLKVTTDAKYLEVGISTKGDNIDYLLNNVIFKKGIDIEECCFWGDEFTYLGPGVKGSDALMITEQSIKGDFFDVSANPLKLPDNVKHVGGGVERFLAFLKEQIDLP